jgi:hypothetical protein
MSPCFFPRPNRVWIATQMWIHQPHGVDLSRLLIPVLSLAQGRPECSRCPVCSCAFSYAQIARETAGAASTRSSLRPLITERAKNDAKLGRIQPRESGPMFHVVEIFKRSYLARTIVRNRACSTSITVAGLPFWSRGCGSLSYRGMFDGLFEGFTTFPDWAACLTS